MDCSSYQMVLHNLELRLAHIHSALSELTEIQADLQKNASESKNDIQATFSRQLESLRTREVYLLNQVDTLHHIKQEHLQLQADVLKKELGALEALIEHTKVSRKSVDPQDIEDIMKRFQQVQLEPEEDPALEFVSNPKRLKKAILSYGSVNTKRFCSGRDEDTSARPSQLMTPFEENVEGKVWLSPKTNSGTTELNPGIVYPVFNEKHDIEFWLALGNEMETCDDEQHDEDSFVMVHPESEQGSPPPFSSHFTSIMNSPNTQWVRQASKMDTVGVSHHQQKSACSFYRPSGSTKDWLKRDQTKDTQTPCQPSQVPLKPIEIEELAEMACVQDTPSGAPSPCGTKTSPRPRAKSMRQQKTTTCCSTKSPAKTSTVNIAEVCKANEKCKTFEECVGDDNCGDTARSGFSGVPESSKNKWLVKSPTEENQWLAKAPADDGKNTTTESIDEETRPNEEEKKEDIIQTWLASKTTPTQDAPAQSYASGIMSQLMKWQLEKQPGWLAKEKSDQFSISQWLCKKEEGQEEKMDIDNKEKSEKVVMKSEWLVQKEVPSDASPVKTPAPDSTSWLVKEKDSGVPQGSDVSPKQEVLQEKWLMKPTFGASTLTYKPTGFPFMNTPTGINQWIAK